jgi:hypothetical protein
LQYFTNGRKSKNQKDELFLKLFPIILRISALVALGYGLGRKEEDIEQEAYSDSSPPILFSPFSQRTQPFWFLNIFGLYLAFIRTVSQLQETRRNFENRWWLILSFHKEGNEVSKRLSDSSKVIQLKFALCSCYCDLSTLTEK